ncbi:DUF2169 domain-containing protein [Archangium sp.]|uniref:DUF2169 family type VI secretion system accessory protein n=1 Tax=Archangium sp. TaxID=1872627 RepID=UPI002D257192|nr:DUF2169 domain-containing protein [Archangium sp.]HYO56488.1 DUF2169 domain-containing protein [Archangium sp.]
MWQLVNNTPYAAERCFARDRHGAEVWVVAVKATYDLAADGRLKLSEQQIAPCMTMKYRAEPGRSSLLYDVELTSFKLATDVLLHGHAYAPGGRPVKRLEVGMRVGSVVRSLLVWGNRFWRKRSGTLVLSEPEPFTRMSLSYENAQGGSESGEGPEPTACERRNPVGTGFATRVERLVDQRAPNIEDPRAMITSWQDRPRPAGLGPIARDWSPRLERAGTYDERWQRERHPLPPNDFDERFHQCAPDEQQVPGFLKGGEPVLLLNLFPHTERLNFTLPRVWLRFRTHLGRDVVEHTASLHTVILEPDVSRVMMVWGTHVPCHGREHLLEKTIILEKPLVSLGSRPS